MKYIDQIYIDRLSGKLRNFRKVNDDYNFSCPICGDSKKTTSKARGWFYSTTDSYSFKCYNCNESISFYGVFKKLNEELFKEYLFEKKKSSQFVVKKSKEQELPTVQKVNIGSDNDFYESITCINKLPNEHRAVKYLLDRKIPVEKFDRFFYCEKFMAWANIIKPGTYKKVIPEYEHDRLILPFLDEDKKPFGFAGRAFGDETPKYLIVKTDDSKEKIYGLDRVDFSKTFYVTEGQIDSLLLDNACAVAGSSFINFTHIKDNKKNAVLCFDNENRSDEIMKSLNKCIDYGFKVFIWPNNIRAKDFNELIKDYNFDIQDLKKLIDSNTFYGMQAKLKFIEWKRV